MVGHGQETLELPTALGTIQVVADESVKPGHFEVRYKCPDECFTKPCVHMRAENLKQVLEELEQK